MSTFFQMILAFFIICLVVTLLYVARRALFTPIPDTKGSKLYTLIAVGGDAVGLEQTIDGLLWLRRSGTMKNIVVISDLGLTPSGRKMAELIAKDNSGVMVCKPDEIADLIEVIHGRDRSVNTN